MSNSDGLTFVDFFVPKAHGMTQILCNKNQFPIITLEESTGINVRERGKKFNDYAFWLTKDLYSDTLPSENIFDDAVNLLKFSQICLTKNYLKRNLPLNQSIIIVVKKSYYDAVDTAYLVTPNHQIYLFSNYLTSEFVSLYNHKCSLETKVLLGSSLYSPVQKFRQFVHRLLDQ
jgi:hypothetical protein